MKIAFDAQLLFEQQKTGIGRNATMIMDYLTDYFASDPDVECILNCFFKKDRKQTEEILAKYKEKGCLIRQNRWVPARVYNHLERLIPFPYKWIFGTDVDITQFFNYTLPFGAAGKTFTIVHDMAYMAYPQTVTTRTRRWLNRYLERYCQRAFKVLTDSEFSRQEIHRYLNVPLEKIEVIYCGVDHMQFHPNYTDEQKTKVQQRYGIDKKYILYLGTLEPRKNIETLITAYWKLKTAMPDAPKLVLAGKKGWLYDSIFETVNDYGLKKEVIFTGYVDEADVPLLLAGASIFVFPSLYEGFGIPPLEAMACATPVITSNVSSLPEVVGEAGITIPPLDVDQLVLAMIRLLTDKKFREQMQNAGLRRAQKFTWERSAQKLADLYRCFGSQP